MKIKMTRYLPGALASAVLILSGCAAPPPRVAAPAAAPAATAAPTATVAPTAAPAATVAPTAAPAATEAPAAPAGKGAPVKLGATILGKVLVDDKGMSLYMFTKDTNGESVCYDKCATAWPPLLTDGAPVAGDGVDAKLLGTTKRKDGQMQVTYKGLPLYYWFQDKDVGDVLGQDVGSVWYVMAANGDVVKTIGTKVNIGDTTLGKALVDDKGMTLYMFTKDTENTSVCYDKCATAWPPLLTMGAPHAGEGADAKLLGMTKRKDGQLQVTYKGLPLYYWFQDKDVGDVFGQDVGSVWYIMAPNGDVVKTIGAKVNVADSSLGKIVTDDKGMTLYMFTKDADGVSSCYDQCEKNWPPLLTKGAPHAGEGADAKLLGMTKRKDGTLQVTYKGMPVYLWAKDAKAGDTTGQKVGGVWFVVAPDGSVVK